MANRACGRISIGGDVPEALFEELRNHCTGHDLKEDWGDDLHFFHAIKTPDDLRKRLKTGEPLVLMDAEASGGQFEELESWLFENDIPYDRHSASGIEWGAELVVWRPGMDSPLSVNAEEDNEEALVSAGPVMEAYRHLREGNMHSAMEHLENVVGPLSRVPPLPPFQLVS